MCPYMNRLVTLSAFCSYYVQTLQDIQIEENALFVRRREIHLELLEALSAFDIKLSNGTKEKSTKTETKTTKEETANAKEWGGFKA